MAETPNYKFYVSSNDKEDFLNWRDKIAGDVDSNFHDVDNALESLKREIDNIPVGKPDAISIPAGGEVILDNDLKKVVGEGPYTLEFTSGNEGVGGTGGGSINGMQNATIVGGENVSVTTDEVNGKITISANGGIMPNLLVNGTAPFGTIMPHIHQSYSASEYSFVVNGWVATGANLLISFNDSAFGIVLNNYGDDSAHFTQYIPEYIYNQYVEHTLTFVVSLFSKKDAPEEAFYAVFGAIESDGADHKIINTNLGMGSIGSTTGQSFSSIIGDDAFDDFYPQIYYVDFLIPPRKTMHLRGVKLEEGDTQTLYQKLHATPRIHITHDCCDELLRSQQHSYLLNAGDLATPIENTFIGWLTNDGNSLMVPIKLPTKMLCRPKALVAKSPVELLVYHSGGSTTQTVDNVSIQPGDWQQICLVFELSSAITSTGASSCFVKLTDGVVAIIADIKEAALS